MNEICCLDNLIKQNEFFGLLMVLIKEVKLFDYMSQFMSLWLYEEMYAFLSTWVFTYAWKRKMWMCCKHACNMEICIV
jgi:hypothetical protein